MNIIRIRQEQRANRISEIAKEIDSKVISGRELNYPEIINLIALRYKCSRRMAREYLDLAIIQAELKVIDDKIVDINQGDSQKQNVKKKT